jgi:hypothetical protein
MQNRFLAEALDRVQKQNARLIQACDRLEKLLNAALADPQ